MVVLEMMDALSSTEVSRQGQVDISLSQLYKGLGIWGTLGSIACGSLE
jgi:hypothetical protein